IESSRPWMARIGDRVLFYAQSSANNLQIWSSDGTASNTVALTSAPSGTGSYNVPVGTTGTHAYFGVSLGGAILGSLAQVLTVTDGTPAGTKQVPLGVVLDHAMNMLTLAGDDNAVYFIATTTTPTAPYSEKTGVYKYEPAAHRTTPLKTTAAYFDAKP